MEIDLCDNDPLFSNSMKNSMHSRNVIQSEAGNYSVFFIGAFVVVVAVVVVVVHVSDSTFVKCSTVMQWKLLKQHVIIALHTLNMIANGMGKHE